MVRSFPQHVCVKTVLAFTTSRCPAQILGKRGSALWPGCRLKQQRPASISATGPCPLAGPRRHSSISDEGAPSNMMAHTAQRRSCSLSLPPPWGPVATGPRAHNAKRGGFANRACTDLPQVVVPLSATCRLRWFGMQWATSRYRRRVVQSDNLRGICLIRSPAPRGSQISGDDSQLVTSAMGPCP